MNACMMHCAQVRLINWKLRVLGGDSTCFYKLAMACREINKILQGAEDVDDLQHLKDEINKLEYTADYDAKAVVYTEVLLLILLLVPALNLIRWSKVDRYIEMYGDLGTVLDKCYERDGLGQSVSKH